MRPVDSQSRRAFAWLCSAIVLLWACAVASDTAIFRWVDDKGVTHYGSAPPPGVKASSVQVAPAPPAAAVSQARAQASKQAAEAERLAAERARSESQQQLQETIARGAAQSRLRQCAVARQQLEVVARGGPIHSYDGRGQRVPLPDDQRDAEIARLNRDVAAYCDAGDTAQEAATRQRVQDAERMAQCLAARDTVRDVEAPAARAPDKEIEQARERMRRLCGTPL